MNAPLDTPANDVAPTLAEQLEASCALARAVKRIEVIEGDHFLSGEQCACDNDLVCFAEVYRVTTAIPLCAQTLCSTECAALALLWDLEPAQDQSPPTVARDGRRVMSPQETARAILAWYGGDASKWTQNAHGRDASGRGYDDDDFKRLRKGGGEVVCACLVGAESIARGFVGIAYGDDDFSDRVQALTGLCAVGWNDQPGRTFVEVVTLLERIAAEPEDAP